MPGSAGVPSTGLLSDPFAMTVDSGRLWVAEQIGGSVDEAGVPGFRTDEFDTSSFAFESQLSQPPTSLDELDKGVAIGHSAPEAQVYVGGVDRSSAEGAVAVFGAGGSLLGSWDGADTPSGKFGTHGVADVAIDASNSAAAGDLYVADGHERVVDVFKPAANGTEQYVTQLTGVAPGEPFTEPYRVAVNDSNGDVLVADASSESTPVVDVFEPEPGTPVAYKFLFAISNTALHAENGSAVGGMAVDGGSGDIYVAVEAGGNAVLEFSAAGAYLGQITGAATPAGEFGEDGPASVAVDPATHNVFVGDYRHQEPSVVDEFGPNVVVPDVTTDSATSVGPAGATLTGTVNPDGAGDATCRFVWGTSPAFGHTAACSPPAVADGSSPVPVQATLEQLEPDTTYYYRLQASNAAGTDPGEASQDEQFTTSGPGLHGVWASRVTAESATLDAAIDPDGDPTSYYFQYGPSNCAAEPSPCVDLPATASGIGAGVKDREVAMHVQELLAGEVYHYRVVVVSEVEPGVVEDFATPDQTFTTQLAGGELTLLDGRRWEMVSPVNKGAAALSQISEAGVIEASARGGALTYLASAPTEPGAQGYANLVQVLAARGAGGWTSRDIATPHEAATTLSIGAGQEYRFFSEDLTSALVEPRGEFTPLSALASERTPFLRRQAACESEGESPAGGCYLPLVSGREGYADVSPGATFGGNPEFAQGLVQFVGATGDLSHVIISAPHLTQTPGEGLYEWSAAKPYAERLDPVSQLPGGGEAVNGLLGYRDDDIANAVSQDGARVFWTTAAGEQHLYVRDVPQGRTAQLDVPQPGALGIGTVNPVFRTADTSGSRAFFTDDQRLAQGSGRAGADLYECEVVEAPGEDSCSLHDLTPETGHEPAEVQGVLGSSEDGSYLYFVAKSVISSAANDRGETAVAGADNLYLLHYDQSAQKWESAQFLAALSSADESDWTATLAHHTARVSPDGKWLALMSDRSLTGYDNTDVNSGRSDEEVFLYDAGSGRLACASCDPSGARPTGIEYGSKSPLVGGFNVLATGTWFAANVPGWTPFSLSAAAYQSRYLSNGGRLFFDSDDALVPQDVNGAEDVYEYEPQGVGDCSEADATFNAGSGGCVGLISSGTAADESAFLDASENGDEVFFLTSAKLLPQDTDTALDIYDARVCTSSSPCIAPPKSSSPCATAESCRSAPAPQPQVFGPLPSATFSGQGNIVETPAPAGKPAGVQPKSLTRAQKLALGLRACAKKRDRKRRTACERSVRKRYETKRSSKAAVKKGQR